jgi:hypothetical protein
MTIEDVASEWLRAPAPDVVSAAVRKRPGTLPFKRYRQPFKRELVARIRTRSKSCMKTVWTDEVS